MTENRLPKRDNNFGIDRAIIGDMSWEYQALTDLAGYPDFVNLIRTGLPTNTVRMICRHGKTGKYSVKHLCELLRYELKQSKGGE